MDWFFGRLPLLPTCYRAKVFVYRPVQFDMDDKQSRGCIPDIYRILHTFNLQKYLKHFIEKRIFSLEVSMETNTKAGRGEKAS